MHIFVATCEKAVVNDMSFSLGFYCVFRVCPVDATYVERETHTRTHARSETQKQKKHPPQPTLPFLFGTQLWVSLPTKNGASIKRGYLHNNWGVCYK